MNEPEQLDDNAVRQLLTLIRDAGLCTDARQLNRVWRELTGYPRLGPCARCGNTHQRYGDNGQPLCPACRPTQKENPK